MAPLPVKLTAQQRKDIRDGLPIVVNLPPPVVVSPGQIEYAKAQYLAGLPVFVLAALAPPANGPMVEVSLT